MIVLALLHLVSGSCAFVTLTTTKEYACSARIFVSRMRTMSTVPVVWMSTFPVPGSLLVARASTNAASTQWRDTFAKFQAARLTQYDKVVFFDSDVLPLNNMDYLCDMEPSMEEAYWLPQPFGNSAGPMVMKTAKDAFSEVLDRNLRGSWPSEMDYVQGKLPLRRAGKHLLISEFIQGDAAQHVLARRSNVTASQMLEQAYSVHFIAEWKPWRVRDNKHFTKEARAIYDIYRREEEALCPSPRVGL